jgi:hypothetical protein
MKFNNEVHTFRLAHPKSSEKSRTRADEIETDDVT